MKRYIIPSILLSSIGLCCAANGLDAGSMARLRSLRNGFKIERANDGRFRLKRAGARMSATTVGAFMILNDGYTVADLEDHDIEITSVRGGMLLVRMNLDDVEAIASHPAVKTLRLEREVISKMDRVREAIGVDRLHAGEVLNHPYTGKGVLCASVDGGFDPNHLNFRNPDGTSRIQNFTYFRPTQSGSYVTENYGPEYIPIIDTENSTTFHGTHTLGIMAGGYRGKVQAAKISGNIADPSSCKAVIEEMDNPYYGIAYNADIAVASGVSTDYYIAQGVEEILNFAWKRQNELGTDYPVVINISMGSNVGPHDGSSFLPKYLDMVSEEDYTNNVICVASGNEGGLNISLHKKFDEKETVLKTGLLSFNPEPEGFPNVVAGQLFVYSDTDEPFELQATVYNRERGSVVFRAVAGIPTGEETGSSVYYATSTDYMSSDSDIISSQLAQYFEGYIGVIGYTDTDESGRYLGVIDSMLWQTASNNGKYVLVVEVKGKAGQRIDIYGDGMYFELSDLGLAEQGLTGGTTDGTIADTATGKNVVVVGSYNTRDVWASMDEEIYSYDRFGDNGVSYFSSWGTLIDGRVLPHVCAPGAAVISSTNEYYLTDNGIDDSGVQATVNVDGRRYSWQEAIGTSMSTPVVSGSIALWKEADPTLRYDDIQDIIARTSIKDEDVTADPTQRVKWGAGKFSAFYGLIEVLRRKGINSISDISTDPGNAVVIRKAGKSSFDVMASGASSVHIEVFSVAGQQVYKAQSENNEYILDLSELPKGIYIINVNGVYNEKVVIGAV